MIEIKLDPVPVTLVVTPENHTIITAVDEALHKIGKHAFITSGSENIHSESSRHYRNQAVDFRIVWTQAQEETFLRELTNRLPAGYRYKREGTHLHVEKAGK